MTDMEQTLVNVQDIPDLIRGFCCARLRALVHGIWNSNYCNVGAFATDLSRLLWRCCFSVLGVLERAQMSGRLRDHSKQFYLCALGVWGLTGWRRVCRTGTALV